MTDVKPNRDTIYHWLRKAEDAKWWLDFYDRIGVDPTFPDYQQHQREYDDAMEQIRWMKQLAAIEQGNPDANP